MQTCTSIGDHRSHIAQLDRQQAHRLSQMGMTSQPPSIHTGFDLQPPPLEYLDRNLAQLRGNTFERVRRDLRKFYGGSTPLVTDDLVWDLIPQAPRSLPGFIWLERSQHQDLGKAQDRKTLASRPTTTGDSPVKISKILPIMEPGAGKDFFWHRIAAIQEAEFDRLKAGGWRVAIIASKRDLDTVFPFLLDADTDIDSLIADGRECGLAHADEVALGQHLKHTGKALSQYLDDHYRTATLEWG
ncbi:hypothetical protein Slin14017_G053010 [Septoria linicola]|nr:hypothetical protein Slin14017_G053010 [Septoria linicola]